ncbi:hypothetical protein H6784_02540 [Candidatus Nomurabacteria bacterium]|nr:hypothetical protein [Candidatus Kaiserbacteria bacterium]MCB9814275.1 hypothetical protein [Candidatus Nomurabacteria bacterium]
MAILDKNTFFDINKLPAEKGLLLFGLSMNKLDNRQNAQNCLEDIRIFSPKKITKPLIGLNFIYSDFLYLYSNKSAPELKQSFMSQVINHKNSIQKTLAKNHIEFQIQHAFNYLVWNQLYVGTTDFSEKFDSVKKIYSNDSLFQKYVNEDCEVYGRVMEDNQINFFLEEFLMCYLASKGQIKLPNEYIENQQKWVLFCYPGRPLKGMIYLYNLNPFRLNWDENPYQNAHYDLESKKLIDFNNIDLDTYSVK